MNSFVIFIPVILFFIALLALSLRKSANTGSDFLKNYFLGDQNLKGFVLAMTLVATYGSVSSFVSGPGLALEFCFGGGCLCGASNYCGLFSARSIREKVGFSQSPSEGGNSD